MSPRETQQQHHCEKNEVGDLQEKQLSFNHYENQFVPGSTLCDAAAHDCSYQNSIFRRSPALFSRVKGLCSTH